jgi:hypothetical protein
VAFIFSEEFWNFVLLAKELLKNGQKRLRNSPLSLLKREKKLISWPESSFPASPAHPGGLDDKAEAERKISISNLKHFWFQVFVFFYFDVKLFGFK